MKLTFRTLWTAAAVFWMVSPSLAGQAVDAPDPSASAVLTTALPPGPARESTAEEVHYVVRESGSVLADRVRARALAREPAIETVPMPSLSETNRAEVASLESSGPNAAVPEAAGPIEAPPPSSEQSPLLRPAPEGKGDACDVCIVPYSQGSNWNWNWGCAEKFCEPPLGQRVYAALSKQVFKGMAARLALYHYDFCDASSRDAVRLNQHGRKRLEQLVRMLQCNVYPLIVEETPEEPGLAAARRDQVLASIAELGFAVPPQWVVVGEPEARGISAAQAVAIDRRWLQSVGIGGTTTTTTTGITAGGTAFQSQSSTESPSR